MTQLTREQFIARYCSNGFAEEEFHENFFALPCQCDGLSCNGWAAVAKASLIVKAHLDLYLPANGRDLIDPKDLSEVDRLMEMARDSISSQEREAVSKLFAEAKDLPDDPESDSYEPEPVL